MSRLKRVFSRAKYAAIGAAVGGALGGLVSRNAASTAAGVGGLLGAILGEKRVDVGTIVDDVKERKPDADVVSGSGDN
ncbi:glycine zipper 2TM domain-containing protein [Halobacterium sp. R2-5]|uniref:glycine zipper 2TM domain-containing protein n=1 Tax=Halobacterium sp. R2-5 TaxID=2715751 RepID=UPI00141FF7D7|nr:glycine zipper 2TM domain-containing protein [Halobacterium sp. R2-5]NIC00375.1 glycine zipper 2TM domain-containing protein [Halobacterium sp. R2-5]